MNEWAAKIERELGTISADLKNMGDDRKEDRAQIIGLRDDFSDVKQNLNQVSGDIKNLHQVISSSTNAINTLATERCGERLDRLEQDCATREVRTAALEKEVDFYKRVFGGTWGITGRLLVGSAALVAIAESIHKWG